MKTDSENANLGKKRRKRREHVQETKQVSLLQKMMAAMWRLFLIVILVVTLIAVISFGYKGLFILSDWMNEAEKRRQTRGYPRI